MYMALVVAAEGLLIASCFQRRSASHFLQVGNILLPLLVLIFFLVSPDTRASQGHLARGGLLRRHTQERTVSLMLLNSGWFDLPKPPPEVHLSIRTHVSSARCRSWSLIPSGFPRWLAVGVMRTGVPITPNLCAIKEEGTVDGHYFTFEPSTSRE